MLYKGPSGTTSMNLRKWSWGREFGEKEREERRKERERKVERVRRGGGREVEPS